MQALEGVAVAQFAKHAEYAISQRGQIDTCGVVKHPWLKPAPIQRGDHRGKITRAAVDAVNKQHRALASVVGAEKIDSGVTVLHETQGLPHAQIRDVRIEAGIGKISQLAQFDVDGTQGHAAQVEQVAKRRNVSRRSRQAQFDVFDTCPGCEFFGQTYPAAGLALLILEIVIQVVKAEQIARSAKSNHLERSRSFIDPVGMDNPAFKVVQGNENGRAIGTGWRNDRPGNAS